jgi:PDZ domain
MTGSGASISGALSARVLALSLACWLVGAVAATPVRAQGADAASDAWARVRAEETGSPPAAAPSPAAAPAPAAAKSAGDSPAPAPATAPSSAAASAAASPITVAPEASESAPIAEAPAPLSVAAAPAAPAAAPAPPPPDEAPPPPAIYGDGSGAATIASGAIPSNLIAPPLNGGESNAVEIPPVISSDIESSAAPPSQSPPAQPANPADAGAGQSQVSAYQASQLGMMNPAQVAGMRQYTADEEMEIDSFGIDLRESTRRLSSGGEMDGLLVTDVRSGSPAALAGLHSYHHATHDVLIAVTMVGSVVVAPAVLLAPVIDYVGVGESYDMIVGVDGVRVANFLDFADRIRDVRPGEIVYLSIVRNGKLVQLRMPIPEDATASTN